MIISYSTFISSSIRVLRDRGGLGGLGSLGTSYIKSSRSERRAVLKYPCIKCGGIEILNCRQKKSQINCVTRAFLDVLIPLLISRLSGLEWGMLGKQKLSFINLTGTQTFAVGQLESAKFDGSEANNCARWSIIIQWHLYDCSISFANGT